MGVSALADASNSFLILLGEGMQINAGCARSLKVIGSLGLGVVSTPRRKFFTTDYTDYPDFLLLSVLIREIRG